MEDLFKKEPKKDKMNNKNYIKKEGVFYFQLSDGREWCPSRQNRGTVYTYKEASLKDSKNLYAKTLDFVAIDFETATRKEQMPCQIGVVVVRNGEIDEKVMRYIQPPQNIYSKLCTKIHGIAPERTMDEPFFDEVWNDIKQYFENEFIVMHNASFDISVLEKALSHYEIEMPNITGYSCTCELFDKMALDKVCTMYGIEIDNHHDGLCDAEACAKLYLAYVNSKTPILSKEEVEEIYRHKNDNSKGIESVQLNFLHE